MTTILKPSNTIIMLLVFLTSALCYGQTGINIKKPLQIFHVDGKGDNPKDQQPNLAQQLNDFVVTQDGFVGIGTAYPTVKLELNGNMRIKNVPMLSTMPKKILVIDDEGNLYYSPIENIAPPLETKIYCIVNKTAMQHLPQKGDYFNLLFDGAIEGVNANLIKISADRKKLFLPPNKTLKLTGSIGIIGANQQPSTNAPAYIISEFFLDNFNNDGSQSLVKTIGYTESSTENYDDGGVSMPIIILRTGSVGASVTLNVKFNGIDSPKNGGYYIGGAATNNTLGSYILIEEI